MFKRGAFLNLSRFEPKTWGRHLAAFEALPSWDHMELWLEFLPTRQQLIVMRDLFAGVHTIMHGPFIDMSLSTDWEDLGRLSVDRCERAIEVAAQIGSRVVTFHAGSYPVFGSHGGALERLCERVRSFIGLRAPQVTLENMPLRRGATRESLGHLEDLVALKRLLPDVTFTLDTGHCLQNGDSIEGFISEHVESIRNIHLHDGILGGRGHLRIGTGQLQLEKFLAALITHEYQGYVSLETITPEDTVSSWQSLRAAEDQLRIRPAAREAEHSTD